jgi:uncharacterized membrane protein YfcA
VDYFLICLAAIAGSALTLFSGFGLGTILLPVFGIFFPLDLAVALTAIVHFLNNIFKLVLFGNKANRSILIRFGIPSIIASFIGAYLLSVISSSQPFYVYQVFGMTAQITILKLCIAGVLLFFALFEIVPSLAQLEFDEKYLALGGLLSGFFGGLSGNQGALRSAFLIRANLSKEVFIGTGVVIACFIDIARLTVYTGNIFSKAQSFDPVLLLLATLSAFAGAFLGSKLVKKVTIKAFQVFVAGALMILAVLLGAGII